MKKLFIVIIALVSHTLSYAQKIDENKVDEFTKSRIVSTEMPVNLEKFESKNYIDVDNDLTMRVRYIKKADNSKNYFITFLAELKGEKYYTFSSLDGRAMFLFEDDSVLEFKQTSKTSIENSVVLVTYSIARKNNDNPQISMENALNKLKKIPVKKIRIYSTASYFEYIIKPENKDVFKNHFNVIQGIIETD